MAQLMPDLAYNTVAGDHLIAMIEASRYGARSPHFEEIIARTHEHFWNPEDPDCMSFAEPLPLDRRGGMSPRGRSHGR